MSWKYVGGGVYESPQGREHPSLRRGIEEVLIPVAELRRLIQVDAESFETDEMNANLERELDSAKRRISELERELGDRERTATSPHTFSDSGLSRADGLLCVCGDVERSPWHWTNVNGLLAPPA